MPGSTFAVETLAGIALETEFLERHPMPDDTRRGPLDELVDGPVVKLLARHEELGPQEFWDAAEAAIGDRVVITWSSDSTLLEISGPERHQGDHARAPGRPPGRGRGPTWSRSATCPTTCAMLAWVGTPYAMANAHPTVLDAVERRAPSNDEDGVAATLSGIFDL